MTPTGLVDALVSCYPPVQECMLISTRVLKEK